MLRAPIKSVRRARQLRKEMSRAERLLWWGLKQNGAGLKFRKQCPQGPFSLDFACLAARLAIEVDGESHERGDRPQRDDRRDRYLRDLGFETVRIPAVEVFSNLEGVVSGIVEACRRRGPLHQPTPSATAGPPPRSGEERE